jgi:hypothetical protein
MASAEIPVKKRVKRNSHSNFENVRERAFLGLAGKESMV